MKLILFLVALAVFDLNEIDSEVITWKIWENSSKVCRFYDKNM